MNVENISIGTVAAAIGLLVQFGALVAWLANEHANQVDLQHRMDLAATRIEREIQVIKKTMEQNKAAQDATISKIDDGGSRKLGLTDERLQSLVRRMDIAEQSIREQDKRDELSRSIAQQAYEFSRDTQYLLQGIKPPAWKPPPSAQDRPIGPGGGMSIKPVPPIIQGQ